MPPAKAGWAADSSHCSMLKSCFFSVALLAVSLLKRAALLHSINQSRSDLKNTPKHYLIPIRSNDSASTL